jgi:hypothetical protein
MDTKNDRVTKFHGARLQFLSSNHIYSRTFLTEKTNLGLIEINF